MTTENKNNKSNSVAYLSLFLSFVVFIYSWVQNSTTNRFAREGIVNSNKPVLIIDSTQSSIKFNLDKHGITKQIGAKIGSNFNGEIQIIDSSSHLFQFSITNKGLDNAKVKGIFFMDTIGTQASIREKLRKGKLPGINFVKQSGFDFMEIPNSFSTKYMFDVSLPLNNQDTFVTHLLILYENDLGYLYDSYVWLKYYHRTFVDVAITTDSTTLPPNNLNMYFQYDSLDEITKLTFLGRAYSFYSYSTKERDKIRALLKYK